MGSKLAGDASTRDRVGCGDVNASAVSKNARAGCDHGFLLVDGRPFLLRQRRYRQCDELDFPGT